jgi:hypothetical protein
MRGSLTVLLLAVCASGCSRKEDTAPPAPGVSARIEKLTLIPPADRPLRADVPATFRLESVPPLPPDLSSEWEFQSIRDKFERPVVGPSVEVTFSSGGVYRVQAKVGPVSSNVVEIPVVRITLADADERPLREGRIGDRVRILVEDPVLGAPGSVTAGGRIFPLEGSAERRLTKPFLLLNDPDDAAAAGDGALRVAPGGRLEFAYRGGPAGFAKIGPSVIHEIPIRFVAVGTGMADLEKAVDLRIAQANIVWEPHGRRFTRGPIVRLDDVRGLLLIRGRAAGVDAQGRSSRCGLKLDGRDVSVPASWRNDGAPMTPKATARALIEKAGKTFQVDLFEDLLAGDREAVVLRVRRRDGSAAVVERLSEGNDVAQAVTPLPPLSADGVEAAPTRTLLSLEEMAILASGKGPSSQGLDVFVVAGLRSIQTRPTFKVYPAGPFAGSALVAWSILDGSGRFPYGLARVVGELLLPPGTEPSPEDTLFGEPMSESAGANAHKRVTAATGSKIAERGRGLSGRK